MDWLILLIVLAVIGVVLYQAGKRSGERRGKGGTG
jgi:preprotein translocase subunit SecG